jgi:hypothetical protein
VNLGFSKNHATSVPLVLNPATGNITPQWNVCFDDYFTTIASSTDDLPDFQATEWRDMFGTSTYHFPPDSTDPIVPSNIPSAALPLSEEIANTKSPIPIPVTNSVPDQAPSSAPSPTSLPLSDVTGLTPPFQQEEMSNFVDKDLQTKSPSPTRSPSTVPTPSPSVPSAVRQLQDYNNTGQTETNLPRASKRARRRPDKLTFNARTEDGTFPTNTEEG